MYCRGQELWSSTSCQATTRNQFGPEMFSSYVEFEILFDCCVLFRSLYEDADSATQVLLPDV
jgi:hypothetical protein